MGDNRLKISKIIWDVLKYVLFLGAGITLFVWVYRGQNVDRIWEGMSRFNYLWIGASFLAFLLSHVFRAIRWRMLIHSIGYEPRLRNVFLSILVMYLANLAVTRMGEVTRCGIVKKYEGVPFTSQLGTVLSERMVDVIFLLLMLVSVMAIDWNVLSSFLHPADPAAGSKLAFIHSTWFLLLCLAAVISLVLLWVLRNRILKLKMAQRFLTYIHKFVDGIKSVFRLRRPFLFILLTVAIYGSYYLSTLFVFKAFAPTAGLSPFVTLVVLAMGSLGMVMPVPGGIGPFDYFAIQSLLLFNISVSDSQLVTLVLHGSTTLFIIVVGAIALALLPLVNRKGSLTRAG
jgi:uncharacterized protein (TIRG00374 family)